MLRQLSCECVQNSFFFTFVCLRLILFATFCCFRRKTGDKLRLVSLSRSCHCPTTLFCENWPKTKNKYQIEAWKLVQLKNFFCVVRISQHIIGKFNIFQTTSFPMLKRPHHGNVVAFLGWLLTTEYLFIKLASCDRHPGWWQIFLPILFKLKKMNKITNPGKIFSTLYTLTNSANCYSKILDYPVNTLLLKKEHALWILSESDQILMFLRFGFNRHQTLRLLPSFSCKKK